MPEAKQYLLSIRNAVIHSLSSEVGLHDSDIGIIMNIHGSTVGRVLADGNLPIINFKEMAVKKKTVVAKTKKVAAPKKAAKKSVATTKKVVKKTAKRA